MRRKSFGFSHVSAETDKHPFGVRPPDTRSATGGLQLLRISQKNGLGKHTQRARALNYAKGDIRFELGKLAMRRLPGDRVKSEANRKSDVMNEAEVMPSGPSISPVEITSVIKLLEIATAEREQDRSAANGSLVAASSILKFGLGGTFSVHANHLQRLDETRSG